MISVPMCGKLRAKIPPGKAAVISPSTLQLSRPDGRPSCSSLPNAHPAKPTQLSWYFSSPRRDSIDRLGPSGPQPVRLTNQLRTCHHVPPFQVWQPRLESHSLGGFTVRSRFCLRHVDNVRVLCLATVERDAHGPWCWKNSWVWVSKICFLEKDGIGFPIQTDHNLRSLGVNITDHLW